MPRAEIAESLQRLEEYARREPRAYRRRVAVLAALGYVPALVTVAALVGAVALLVGFALVDGRRPLPDRQFIVPFAFALTYAIRLVYHLARGAPDAPGVPDVTVDRALAPPLFAELDALRSALGAPAINRALLFQDLGAAVVSSSRFAMLRWRHELVLGVPLLLALTPDQCRAVLALALARAGGPDALAARVTRLDAHWLRAAASPSSGLSRRWLEWYVPRLHTLSLPLRRLHERRADERAAALVGAETLGQALVALAVADRRLAEDFYPALFRRAFAHAAPPASLSADLAAAFTQPHRASLRWLDAALAEPPEPTAPRVPLAARLAALGLDPDTMAPPAPPPPHAAQALLGPAAGSVLSAANTVFCDGATREWAARHAWATRARARLDALALQQPPLDPAALLERARTVRTLDGDAAALPFAREAHAASPADSAAMLLLAQCLLATGDDAGAVLAARAMTLDERSTEPACAALYEHALSRGRRAEARAHRERYLARITLVRQAEQERQALPRTIALAPHGLAPETVLAIGRVLAAENDVRAAWLVRRMVTVMPEEPSYLLVLELRTGWLTDASREQRLASSLLARLEELELDVRIARASAHPWLRRRASRAAGGVLPLDDLRARLRGEIP